MKNTLRGEINKDMLEQQAKNILDSVGNSSGDIKKMFDNIM